MVAEFPLATGLVTPVMTGAVNPSSPPAAPPHPASVKVARVAARTKATGVRMETNLAYAGVVSCSVIRCLEHSHRCHRQPRSQSVSVSYSF